MGKFCISRLVRLAVASLALGSPAFAACAAAWSNGYGYCRTVTVDRTKVPNTDQTNFPVTVNGTYAFLAGTGSGGRLTNASGYDAIFTSDNAGTSLLDFELVPGTYNATTGAVEFWIRIPTLTTASDFVFYIFYGNSLISTYQGNTAGTWNSAYPGVWHLPDGVTLGLLDSTGNANNLTNHSGIAAAGQIDGGSFLSGAYLSNPTNGTFNGTNYTIEGWVKLSASSLALFGRGDAGVPGQYLIFINGSNQLLLDIPFVAGGVLTGGTALTDGVWTHVALTKNGNDYTFFVNGVSDGTATNASAPAYAGDFEIGSWAATFFANADMDEPRLSSTARSADWLRTGYNNQFSPSTFYAFGSEVANVTNKNLLLLNIGKYVGTTFTPLGKLEVPLTEACGEQVAAVEQRYEVTVSTAGQLITLPALPGTGTQVKVYRNGLLQGSADYTLAGAVITFAGGLPSVGDTVVVFYG